MKKSPQSKMHLFFSLWKGLCWRCFFGLCTIGLGLLFFAAFGHLSVFAANWKVATIENIVAPGYWHLSSQNAIQISGIKFIDPSASSASNYCFSQPTWRRINDYSLGKRVRFRSSKNDHTFYLQDYDLHTDIALYLLSQGMAHIDYQTLNPNWRQKYETALRDATAKKLGLHAWCGGKKWLFNLYKYQQKKELTRHHPELIGDVMVVSDAKALSADTLLLANGMIVKLLGTRAANANGDLAEACLAREGKIYLQSLLAGRRLFLYLDRTFINDEGELPRYVYAIDTHNAFSIPTFINKAMVESGLVVNHFSTAENRHRHQFAQAHQYSMTDPDALWHRCEDLIYQQANPDIKIHLDNKKTISTNDNCFIKGNISGTKASPVRKYHTPASPWYQRTKPEACFDSEAEAENAGFIKVK